jgi:glutaredoxin-dependent peroxiredoxin
MSISVGDHAPELSLPSKPGSDPVSLSDYQGDKNVVLLFFPLAWSPVCTQELCSMRDAYSSLRELDAEVLAVSVDSPFALQAWAKEQSYEFPLLSDFNKEASRSYDVLIEDLLGLKGVSKRAAFVIDKEGVVRYAEVTPSPKELPDFDAIRSTVQGLG